MPASLSMDLRKRIVEAYERGDGSCRVLGLRFDVSHSTVAKLVQQFRTEGSLKPRTDRCGRKRSISGEDERALIQHLQEFPDATVQERKQALGLTCHAKTVWLSLRRLKARFKKSLSEQLNRTDRM